MLCSQNKTKRLVLRLPEMDFAEPALAYYRRNREFFSAYDPVRDESFYTLEHQRDILRNEMNNITLDMAYRFYVFEAEGQEIIGITGLNSIVRGAFHSCFLSYKLDKDMLCRGFMTEAVGETVRLGFSELNLHRIEANIMPKNRASLRVVQKLGFVNEGVSREYLFINGAWEDHIHMVKINRAWEER